MNKNINSQILNIFDKYSDTIWVYLKKTNTKGSSYDAYRNTGYTKTQQSPYPVKAIISQQIPYSLSKSEIGLVTSGAISIFIKKSDVNAIKIAEKIEYNLEDYTPYSKALGNKVQILKRPGNFYRVILFRKGNDSKKNQY